MIKFKLNQKMGKLKILKTKRGFLLAEETLKIILGVIAIGFLSYLLFSIYQSNKTSNELEFARESLNHLFSEIGQQRQTVEIYNPNGWWLLSDSESNELCICADDEHSSCISKGVCRENPESYSVNEAIKIDNPPIILEINQEEKIITKK